MKKNRSIILIAVICLVSLSIDSALCRPVIPRESDKEERAITLDLKPASEHDAVYNIYNVDKYSVFFPRTDEAVRGNLLHDLKSLASDEKGNKTRSEIYLKLSKIEIALGNEFEAIDYIKKYFESEDDTVLRYERIISFYEERLMWGEAYDKQHEYYVKLYGEYAAFTSDELTKEELKRKQYFKEKTVNAEKKCETLTHDHILKHDIKRLKRSLSYYFKDDYQIFSDYIDYLTNTKEYDEALAEIDKNQANFPDHKRDLLRRRAEVYFSRGDTETAERLYADNFAPIDNREIYYDYLKLLRKFNLYYQYKKRLTAVNGNDLNKDQFLRLLFLYLHESNINDAGKLFDSFGDILIEGGFNDKLLYDYSRVNTLLNRPEEALINHYNIYMTSEDDELKKRSLLSMMDILAGRLGSDITFNNRSYGAFIDYDKLDTNPGVYSGVLSLIYNKAGMTKKSRALNRASKRHFTSQNTVEIYKIFEREYKGSEHYKKAFEKIIDFYMGRKKYDTVIRYCDSFIKDYPDDRKVFGCYDKIATIYSYRELVDKRISILGAALEHSKKFDDESLYQLRLNMYVDALVSAKRYAEVIDIYKRQIDENPDNETLYIRLIDFFKQQRRFDDELNVYKQALKHFNDKSWHHKIARWYIRRQSQEAANRYIKEVSHLYTDHDEFLVLLDYLNYSTKSTKSFFRRKPIRDTLYIEILKDANRKFPLNLPIVNRLLNYYGYLKKHYTEDKESYMELALKYFMLDNGIKDKLFYFLLETNRGDRITSELEHLKTMNPAEAYIYAFYATKQCEFEEASGYYKPLYEHFSSNVNILNEYSTILKSIGSSFLTPDVDKIKNASDIYTRLLFLTPSNQEHYVHAAETYFETGRFKEAVEIAKRALKIKQASGKLTLDVATLFWDYYQFDSAIKVIKDQRTLTGNEYMLSVKLAAVYESKKDYDNAVSEYINTYMMTAEQRTLRRIIYLYKYKGVSGVIDSHFKEYLNNNPSDYQAYIRYADFLQTLGKPAEQLEFLISAARKTDSVNLLETIYDELKRHLNVDDHLLFIAKKLVELQPKNMYRMEELAKFYETMGDNKNAEEVYKRIVELAKEIDRNIYMQKLNVLSNYYIRRKEYKKSISVMRERIELETSEYQRKSSFLILAEKYASYGYYDDAIKIYEELKAKYPKNIPVLVGFTNIYEKKGEYDNLLAAYKEIFKLSSSHEKEIRYNYRISLVKTLKKMERTYEALDYYMEALNIMQSEPFIDEILAFAKEHDYTKRFIGYYEKTSQKSVKDYRWHFVLGYTYNKLDDFKKSSEYFEKAIVNEPQKIRPYEFLRDIYMKTEEYQKLLEILKSLYLLSEGELKYQFEIADAYHRLGDDEMAMKTIEEIISSKKGLPSIIFKSAIAINNWGNHERSLEYFDRALFSLKSDLTREALNREHIKYYTTLLSQKGKFVKAFDTLVELENIYEDVLTDISSQNKFRYLYRNSLSTTRYALNTTLAESLRDYGLRLDYNEIGVRVEFLLNSEFIKFTKEHFNKRSDFARKLITNPDKYFYDKYYSSEYSNLKKEVERLINSRKDYRYRFRDHTNQITEKIDSLIGFAKRALDTKLEEHLRIKSFYFKEIFTTRAYSGRYQHYNLINELNAFYKERADFIAAYDFLKRYSTSLAFKGISKQYYDTLFELVWSGNISEDEEFKLLKEIRDLTDESKRRQGSRKINYHVTDDVIGYRFLDLYYKFDKENLLKLNNFNYLLQFQDIEFFILKNEKDAALNAVDKIDYVTPLWRNAKKAMIYTYFNDFSDEARKCFETALTSPKNIKENYKRKPEMKEEFIDNDWYNFANYYAGALLKNNDSGYTYYNMALPEYSPVSSYSYSSIAYMLKDAGRDEDALSFYKKALGFMPRDLNYIREVASLYVKIGDNENALNTAKTIIAGDASVQAAYDYFKLVLKLGLKGDGRDIFIDILIKKFNQLRFDSRRMYLNFIGKYLRDNKDTKSFFELLKSIVDANDSLIENYNFALDSEYLSEPYKDYFYEKLVEMLKGRSGFNKQYLLDYFKKYIKYLSDNSRYDEAKKRLDELTNELKLISADSTEYLSILFYNYYKSDDLSGGLSILKDHINKAKEAYNKKKRYSNAINILNGLVLTEAAKELRYEYFEYLFEKEIASTDDYFDFSLMLLDRGEDGRAYDILELLYKKEGESDGIVKKIAATLEEKGKLLKAADYRGILVNRNDADFMSKAKIAYYYFTAGEYEQAKDICIALLKNRFVPKDVKEYISTFYHDIVKDGSFVLKDEINYLSDDMQNSYYYVILAKIYKAAGDNGKYIDTLISLNEKYTYYDTGHKMLGDHYYEKSDLGKAKESYMKALFINPDDYKNKLNYLKIQAATDDYNNILGIFNLSYYYNYKYIMNAYYLNQPYYANYITNFLANNSAAEKEAEYVFDLLYDMAVKINAPTLAADILREKKSYFGDKIDEEKINKMIDEYDDISDKVEKHYDNIKINLRENDLSYLRSL
jgi:tetratricopeptide (TPR) repeat protein